MLRAYLSRLSSGFPALFYSLKKADLVAHYLFRIKHEPEFLVFAKLFPKDASLLIADIGRPRQLRYPTANIGRYQQQR